jgi:hypothetical protein
MNGRSDVYPEQLEEKMVVVVVVIREMEDKKGRGRR